MDETDRAILHVMQNGIALLGEPFAEVAEEIGISQDEVIARLKGLVKSGVVRRFGVSVNQQKIGITASALVAWKVPPGMVEEIGEMMSSYKEITHCYERKTIPKRWEYNLFTVTHGRDRESVRRFIKKLSMMTGLNEYLVLFSVMQFKRSSVTLPECNHPKKE